MTSRLVALAVLVIAAVAAADAFRPDPKERVVIGPQREPPPSRGVERDSGGLVAVGQLTRERVLLGGREYLSAEAVDAAFPSPLRGLPFDIAHVARAPDGTVALAIYKFPEIGPARAAIQLWRERKLVSAFDVPPGSFGRGLGFTSDGLVAALAPDGASAVLFDRDGLRAGSISVTSL